MVVSLPNPSFNGTPSSAINSNVRTPQQLTDFLVALYPLFKPRWDDSLFREGSGFTYHGVCSEFSHFFKELSLPLNPISSRILFQEIERVLANQSTNYGDLANAWCTCFLENIASTTSGAASIPNMGPSSLSFFKEWHVKS